MPEKFEPEQPAEKPEFAPELIQSWGKYGGRLAEAIGERNKITKALLANPKIVSENDAPKRDQAIDDLYNFFYQRDIALTTFWDRNNLDPIHSEKDQTLQTDLVLFGLKPHQKKDFVEKLEDPETILKEILRHNAPTPEIRAFLEMAEGLYYTQEDRVLKKIKNKEKAEDAQAERDNRRFFIKLMTYFMEKKLEVLRKDNLRSN